METTVTGKTIDTKYLAKFKSSDEFWTFHDQLHRRQDTTHLTTRICYTDVPNLEIVYIESVKVK